MSISSFKELLEEPPSLMQSSNLSFKFFPLFRISLPSSSTVTLPIALSMHLSLTHSPIPVLPSMLGSHTLHSFFGLQNTVCILLEFLRKCSPTLNSIHNGLKNSDYTMRHNFFLGCPFHNVTPLTNVFF
jgi:hypothetical protein